MNKWRMIVLSGEGEVAIVSSPPQPCREEDAKSERRNDDAGGVRSGDG
jgi:hypothetical protein